MTNITTNDLALTSMKALGEESAKKLGKGAIGSKSANLGKIQGAASAINTALSMFSAAGKGLDMIADATGLSYDDINQSTANRAGFGKENKINNLLGKVPGMRFLTMGATEKINANESIYTASLSPGYSATMQDISAAKDLDGQNVLIGKEQAKSFANSANAQSAAIDRIGRQTELAKNNSLGTMYQYQNFTRYNGISPKLLVGVSKKGGTIQNLETARDILQALSKKNVTKYQLGGKIIDPSKNIIPDGALHKNLNHLSDVNEELTNQVTRKGVPVVSEDSEGNITQHAEVEVGEIIFTLENSQKLEEYWKQYKETEDDSVAIECGKFVTHEILRNTIDKAGIKKQVE